MKVREKVGPWVIKIIGHARGDAPCPLANQYLYRFDPDGGGGRGTIIGTKNPKDAKVFTTVVEASAEWRRASKIRPQRLDGRPNRPLSAYSIEILPRSEALTEKK